MKVTITEKHLNRALRARKKGSSPSKTCLIAQAAKEVYGKKFEGCAEGFMCIRTLALFALKLGVRASKLIKLYDHYEYDLIRGQLPVIVHFPDVPK